MIFANIQPLCYAVVLVATLITTRGPAWFFRARESFVTSQNPRVELWYSAQRQSSHNPGKARDTHLP